MNTTDTSDLHNEKKSNTDNFEEFILPDISDDDLGTLYFEKIIVENII